ncbi:hypothetical protein KO317_02175 [Candidatus Micrarchaeota archaeon]|jgi:hypothetical protein|nr:hypothetical protein [Candidatus Micrarchaeota archaeon]
MNKLLGILLICGIFISLSYAAECKGDLCCEGEDSGYKYWTGNCADYAKDPSLMGMRCSSGTWVHHAVKCECPSGYTIDTSKNEDGICKEIKATKPAEEPEENKQIEPKKEETPKEETKSTSTQINQEIDNSNKNLDTYYKYSPVNAIDNENGKGCGLSTIIITSVLGALAIAYKH